MRAIALWICCCAYLNCAGWILAAVHELNSGGYAIVLLPGFCALAIWRKKTSENFLPQINWQKLSRRFCRPFPLAFLIVAALEFLGGAIYAPNNYDALTYRLPRILNWIAAGHWVWIPTVNERMNYSTTAWEWIATPFFALLRSDRGLFLINTLGFLLMPGLLFSIFRRLGVARKVAWTWMWILPLAYGYATQAGSVGNDLTGALFALISVYFGLRARCSKDARDIWLAALAAALMTGVKISNLPLLLPCLVAAWPALPRLRGRWIASLGVVCIAILISAAPTIILNQLNTGCWNGDPENSAGIQIKNPGAALFGNGLLLLQQSFMPPVLPGARRFNDLLNEKMPASWHQILEEKFPRYFLGGLNELPQEESAGLGLGVTLLLLAGGIALVSEFFRKKSFPKIPAIGLAAWISFFFFILKMGSEADPRLLLPYYPLAIVPILLLPSQGWLLRFRAWNFFIFLAALSILPAIIFSPSRPLFPAVQISQRFAKHHPDSTAAQRMATVYSTYARRNDSLAPLREHLPDDAEKIGFVAGTDDTDYSLWRPFGERQVVYLQNEIKNSANIPGDVEWIAVKRTAWPEFSDLSLEEWADQHHAKIVLSVPITTVVAWGEETWCLLQIQK
jgi:hypothetical protein